MYSVTQVCRYDRETEVYPWSIPFPTLAEAKSAVSSVSARTPTMILRNLAGIDLMPQSATRALTGKSSPSHICGFSADFPSDRAEPVREVEWAIAGQGCWK